MFSFLVSVKVDQKLTLFHLLNDVVQHSKKRNYDDLLEKFQVQIKEAMPHLKNLKITEKVIRCLNIWSERQVFEDKFVQELITSIDPSQNRAEQDILDNFQVWQAYLIISLTIEYSPRIVCEKITY